MADRDMWIRNYGPLRIAIAIVLSVLAQGCDSLKALQYSDPHHHYNLQVSERVAKKVFENGPHALYHIIVEKPAGVGWEVNAYSKTMDYVAYWNDVSPTHTMSASVSPIYQNRTFRDLNEVIEQAQKDIPGAWREDGEVVSFDIAIEPEISKRCVVLDGRIRSKKYGLITRLGMICPVALFPSDMYYIHFAEATGVQIDETRFRDMALKFMRAVTRREPTRRPLAN